MGLRPYPELVSSNLSVIEPKRKAESAEFFKTVIANLILVLSGFSPKPRASSPQSGGENRWGVWGVSL